MTCQCFFYSFAALLLVAMRLQITYLINDHLFIQCYSGMIIFDQSSILKYPQIGII